MGDRSVQEPMGRDAIAYGLWLDDAIPWVSESHATPLRDLTLSWLRFGYQGPVIEATSLEAILDTALAEGYRACFIQTPGHIISEDWMLPHWQRADFHRCLKDTLLNRDFLVCAEPIAAGNYWGLDTACLLVDLQHYQALGCPEFGSASDLEAEGEEQHTHRLMMASESQSGLDALDESASVVPTAQGWGFIDASLRAGLRVPALPNSLTEKRASLQSAPTMDLAHIAPLPDSVSSFLHGVKTQIERGRSGVFLWNIESYADLPSSVASDEQVTWQDTGQVVTDLYCVAAGFKPVMLLNRHGFDANTRLVFFDYSEQALAIRRILLEEWDGRDYPAFCRQLMQRFPSDEAFYQLWNGLQPEQIDWDDVQRLWTDELNHWGGEAGFQQQWQAQRALQHEYVLCDVVGDPAPLLQRIKASEQAIIWWSNAFFTISSNWLLSIEQRRQRFSAWIKALAQACPQCQIYGADHNNTPVNGIKVQEYAVELKQRIANGEQDELRPQLRTMLPLRF